MLKIKEMRKLRLYGLVLVAVFIAESSFAQYNPLGQENSFLAMDRQTGFVVMTSAALGSYLISQFLTDDNKLDFYQAHIGYYSGKSGGGQMHPESMSDGQTDLYDQTDYCIFMESFGVEREFSKWFSMRLEANIQEFTGDNYFSMGGGIKTYYKWTFLRKLRVHPFIEYGAGVFYAAKKFPEDGSRGTFNLNYAVGGEYILPNNDKIMADFNFKHHSNNNLGDANPGFDGNGVSVSYSWFWKEKKAKHN